MLSLEHEPFLHIRHKVAGRPSVTDIALALEYALQHDDVPILWDLRDLEPDQDIWVLGASQLLPVVEDRRSRMSLNKRAFVVADVQADQGIAGMLERLHVPWPWGVFRDLSSALTWLAE